MVSSRAARELGLSYKVGPLSGGSLHNRTPRTVRPGPGEPEFLGMYLEGMGARHEPASPSNSNFARSVLTNRFHLDRQLHVHLEAVGVAEAHAKILAVECC